MKPNKRLRDILHQEKIQLAILAAVCLLVIALFVVVVYRYRYAAGIDSISYISIARQYAEGVFGSAINAYWSPMVSWLMAPSIKIGAEGSVAFLLVNALTSVFILLFGTFSIWRWTNKNFFAALFFAATVSPFLISSLRVLTPDLLAVAWILIFVAALVYAHKSLLLKQPRLWRAAWLIGAVGALGYFIKLYLVPVFIVGLAIWWIAHVISRKKDLKTYGRKKAARYLVIFLVASMMCAFAVSAPWIIALSAKYERPMVGSSLVVNMESKFNEEEKREQGIATLDTPPNDHAVSVSEDRTPDPSVTQSSGEGSSGGIKDKLQYYFGERLKAFPYYLNRIASIWPFTMPIISMVGVAILLGYLSLRRDLYVVTAWIISVIYFFGYAAITSTSSGGGNERYYWPVAVLAIAMVAMLLPKLWAVITQHRQWLRNAIFVVVIVGLAGISFTHYLVGIRYTNSIPILNPVGIGVSERSRVMDSLFDTAVKSEIYLLAEQIKNDNIIPKGSKMVGDNYRMLVRLAYYLESQAYGRSGDGNYYNLDEPEKALEEHGIEYIINFTPEGEEPIEIVEGEVVGNYTYIGSCLDDKGSELEACAIQVVKIER